MNETFSRLYAILKKSVNGEQCEQFQNTLSEGAIVIPESLRNLEIFSTSHSMHEWH